MMPGRYGNNLLQREGLPVNSTVYMRLQEHDGRRYAGIESFLVCGRLEYF